MTTDYEQTHGPSLSSHALLLGGSIYAYHSYGEPLIYGDSVNLVPALIAWLGLSSCAGLARALSGTAASTLERIDASLPENHKGSAGWATWRKLRRKRAVKGRYGWAPYWGVYQPKWYSKRRAVFAGYSSNAVTFGPAGSGKGVGVVLPTVLSIPEPKLILDFKSVNACMLKPALEQQGQQLAVINIGGLYEDRLGPTECYNPLEMLAENLTRPGGLANMRPDCAEIAMQLYPDPDGGGGEDRYWYDGSRNILSVVIQYIVLVHGAEATLMQVQALINDRQRLQTEMLWAAGSAAPDVTEPKNGGAPARLMLEQAAWAVRTDWHTPGEIMAFIADFRRRAGIIAEQLSAEDTRQADTFLTGARQAIADLGQESRAARILRRSTIRFSAMKEDSDNPLNIALCVDPTRMSTQSTIAGLLQWCAITEWLRHPNAHRQVTVIGDEITNLKVNKLPELMTFGREFGIRLHLFIQSLAAFENVYGRQAVNTLLSETQIKQFLPGQQDPEMLERIQTMLGEESIITASHSHSASPEDRTPSGRNTQEEGKPLMMADEIRRMKQAILFIGSHKPIRVKLPPVSAIHPFKYQIGVNPMYGKPWIKWTKLRLGSRTPWPRRLLRLITTTNHRRNS